jgi:hypothetical protein
MPDGHKEFPLPVNIRSNGRTARRGKTEDWLPDDLIIQQIGNNYTISFDQFFAQKGSHLS